MGASRYNAEGYRDPTAYEAITRIENKAAADRRKKVVYVCSPFKGDIENNIKKARKYCHFVVLEGAIPIAAHLLFPQFMDDNNPEERKAAINMGVELISKCDEVWIFGTKLTDGMVRELKAAWRLNLRIRCFSESCEEETIYATS